MRNDNRQWEERGLRAAVLRGDQEAWRVLFDRCFDALFAYIDYRTGRRGDRTEEVVQEAWMIAVRRFDSFDPTRSSFESWLRGIALNILRNHQRAWKRAASLEDLEAVAVEDGSGPEIELAEQISLALTALPERYQSVLRAKYEEKLSVVEIARRWKESAKAVESLLSRAREAFRKAYTGLEREP